MKIQFTVYSTTGKYKPISTVVEVPTIEELSKPDKLRYWKKRALSRIVAQRYKSGADLLAHGYTTMKFRIYDKEEREAYEKAQARKKAIADYLRRKKEKGNWFNSLF